MPPFVNEVNKALMWAAMSIAALLVLASAAVSAEPPPSHGVELVSARVTVEILRPAIVRQDRGLQDRGADAARPQISRREGAVFFEFE